MSSKDKPYTVGSSSFDPDLFIRQWSKNALPKDADFEACIEGAFGLKKQDNYVYHAVASVTLQQVQRAINGGSQNGMHAWYRDECGNIVSAMPL